MSGNVNIKPVGRKEYVPLYRPPVPDSSHCKWGGLSDHPPSVVITEDHLVEGTPRKPCKDQH